MISFDNTPPPIALEPLLAYPIRDPIFAGSAGPAPSVHDQPVFHVGGYRSLIFNFEAVQSPAAPPPQTIDFTQGWPIDSLPAKGMTNNIRAVWHHRALIPGIASFYTMACRIPVVAPLFSWAFQPEIFSPTGTQQVNTCTIHGTNQPCSEVQPIDPGFAHTVGAEVLYNRRFWTIPAGGFTVPAGGSVDIGANCRRWYVGRAYLSWFTNMAANTGLLALGTSPNLYLEWRGPANVWQTDEVEIPSDMDGLILFGPVGSLLQGGVGIGTQPLP